MQRMVATPRTGDVTEGGLPQGMWPRKAHCVHDELLADGSMILYNACRQQVMTVNATAALIWDCCDGTRDFDALVAEVREVFPTAPDPARDVRDLLDHLYQTGMLIVVAAQS